MRLTIGGDKLDYTNETVFSAANLFKTKILLNSTISNAKEGARFFSLDIKNFFLQTPLLPGGREYMRIHSKNFDQKFHDLYQWHDKVDKDGYVYCKVKLRMYGVKRATVLVY